MLQSDGNNRFTDVTSILNPDYDTNTEEADYTPQVEDIDNSGIDSYLLTGSPIFNTIDDSRQSNYLLLNDGTGRLYVALHDQFVQIGRDVMSALQQSEPEIQFVNPDGSGGGTPAFRAYLAGNGTLNFVADQIGGQWLSLGVWQTHYYFANVPMEYEVTTDFTTPITITDRNGSHLIRTFAGNDTIYSGNDGGYCHIDGGLGQNTVVYSGDFTQYSVTASGADWVVADDRPGSPDGTDTLVSIQTLHFADQTISLPCFCKGTGIRTTSGDVLVERLGVGDRVQTCTGVGSALVVWTGHRRVDCRRHPRPQDIWPVRIGAGAFGSGQPQRDLLLSPDHAVFVDGVLIPIKHLINGITIKQIQVDEVTYHHIELPAHGVLLAEGLPAESYLDTGTRCSFEISSGPAALYPDFSLLKWETGSCAPLIVTGPKLDAVRQLVNSFTATKIATAAPIAT